MSNYVPISAHYEHLTNKSSAGSKYYFLSTTFVPFEELEPSANPVSAAKCFRNFERFYVRLLSELMNNYSRKRHLQPLTYAYLDFPFTKKLVEKKRSKVNVGKEFGLSEAAKRCARQNKFHPEMTAHIHAIMRMPAELIESLEHVAPGLETLFRKLDRANQTLKLERLSSKKDFNKAFWYSSELIRNRPAELKGADLYIVLPKAKSEPIYAMTDYDRELAQKLADDRALKARNVDNWRAGYFG